MKTTFLKLNAGWNAEPNAPEPKVRVMGTDVLLSFYVNAFRYPEFTEEELGLLRFVDCDCYRLGPTNDEGWYRDQCRFSKLAPEWGEFYLVSGASNLLNAPQDWIILQSSKNVTKHFLFYFRDSTFECVARKCALDITHDNSLRRIGFADC